MKKNINFFLGIRHFSVFLFLFGYGLWYNSFIFWFSFLYVIIFIDIILKQLISLLNYLESKDTKL